MVLLQYDIRDLVYASYRTICFPSDNPEELYAGNGCNAFKTLQLVNGNRKQIKYIKSKLGSDNIDYFLDVIESLRKSIVFDSSRP